MRSGSQPPSLDKNMDARREESPNRSDAIHGPSLVGGVVVGALGSMATLFGVNYYWGEKAKEFEKGKADTPSNARR